MKIDKKFIFILVGRISQALLSVVVIRLMTKFLSKNEIGNQYVINSVILWFSLVLINPFGMYINRHLHEWSENQQFISSLKKINFYFASIAFLSLPIVLFIKKILLVAKDQNTAAVMFLIFGYVYLSTWFQTLGSFFNLFNRQKQFVALNILALASGLLFSIILINLYEAQTFFWLLGLLLGQTTSLLLGFYLMKKDNYFGAENSINVVKPIELFNRTTFNYCYPVALATVFMWFQNQGYRLVVERYLGTEALAGIGLGLGIAASLASVVESLTTQYLYPKYFSEISNATVEVRKAAWEKIWRSAISIYIPCCLAVIAVSNIVISILTSATFHIYGYLVALGAILELCRQLTGVIYLISHSEKNTKVNILPYFLGAMTLGIGLYILKVSTSLSILFIAGLLIAAYLVTLIFNSIVAFKILAVEFHFNEILRSVFISLPVLLFFPLLKEFSVGSVILSLFLGVYSLGIIYYQLKKQTEVVA